jgi:hypothetical protein
MSGADAEQVAERKAERTEAADLQRCPAGNGSEAGASVAGDTSMVVWLGHGESPWRVGQIAGRGVRLGRHLEKTIGTTVRPDQA